MSRWSSNKGYKVRLMYLKNSIKLETTAYFVVSSFVYFSCENLHDTDLTMLITADKKIKRSTV